MTTRKLARLKAIKTTGPKGPDWIFLSNDSTSGSREQGERNPEQVHNAKLAFASTEKTKAL